MKTTWDPKPILASLDTFENLAFTRDADGVLA
jgi:hypothetical protein